MKHLRHPRPGSQQGRTILELMISITIGLVILLALGTVYVGTTSTSRQSEAVSRMSEDAAIAFNLLGGGLQMAGFSAPRQLVLPGGAIIDGVQVRLPDRNFTGAGVRGCDHGFVSISETFDNLSCAGGSGPAAVAIRFEGDIYNTVKTADGDPTDCLNNAITLAKASPSDMDGTPYRLIQSRYLGNGSVPTLSCAGNGNAYNPDPLLQYVEDIRIRYGVATDPDSREVAYYATAAQVDALAGDTNERWGRVVSLRLCLVMRSQERDQAGAGNYIDCDGASVASANGFARRSFTTLFALRNRSGFLLQ